MKVNCRSLASLGMTICLTAAAADAQAPRAAPRTISGVVRGADHQPMADVEVALRPTGKRARTDSAGAYRMDNVAPGRYVAVARKTGFLPERWDIAVQREAGAVADFTLAARDEHPVLPDSNRKCEGLDLRGFQCRESVANGLFFDFPDIDTDRATVPELFNDVDGFRVRRGPVTQGGRYLVEPSSGSRCILWFVDGRAASRANPVPSATRDIYAMEIYRMTDSVPVTDMRELKRVNNLDAQGNCRIVLLWTTWGVKS